MKFRKRPIEIEAERWFPGKHVENVVEFTDFNVFRDGQTLGRIKTLEGDMIVSPGDWVITGIKGEKYPCKPDIFEATYEPVGVAPLFPESGGEMNHARRT